MAIYRSLMVASVRSQLAYPTSFALQCLAQALVQLEDMVVVLVLFSRISAMGGFTLPEVLLIYSLAGISFGLTDMLVGSLDKVGTALTVLGYVLGHLGDLLDARAGPVSVFSGWLLRLMAFVMPGAFVAYYPALAILGKPDPLGLPAILPYCPPLVAVLAAGVAALIWRAGLRHYVGTGS